MKFQFKFEMSFSIIIDFELQFEKETFNLGMYFDKT